jgi:hypothetical protein
MRAQHVHDRVVDPKRRVEGAARILRTTPASRPITDWPPTSIAPLRMTTPARV